MNLSGKAIRYWLEKENILTQNLLVIADDIALPMGTLRIRKKGSDGGHNGLINIIETLGTTEFPRLRIGIGADFPKGGQVDYVLGRWTNEQEKTLIPKVETAVEIIKSIGLAGVDATMNLFNNK
jgi:PTH1 family peptidyl-tRNA hydrolase